MGFPRKKYWSGLPFPPPGDLPDPGIKPASPVSPILAGRFFTLEPPDIYMNVKNLPANAGDIRDMGWIPGLGASPG